MKRPIVTLGLVGLFAFPLTSACNQAETPDEDGGGSGTGNSSAGTGALVIPTAGTGQTAAGTGSATPTAGSAAGGASTAGAGAGGEATAGTTAGGSAGTSAGGADGGGAGASNPGCPAKIDSSVMCAAPIVCPNSYCGAFQLGAKNCECAGATGPYDCSPCSYAGKTETIVVKPEEALAACAADDMTLEKSTPGCTKGDRCHSLRTDASRFCACWDDPVKGGTKWDCDTQPTDWPL